MAAVYRNSSQKIAIFCSAYFLMHNAAVLPQVLGPQGSTDLCFLSPQLDTSLHNETTDSGHHKVCLFTFWLSLALTVSTHGEMEGLPDFSSKLHNYLPPTDGHPSK